LRPILGDIVCCDPGIVANLEGIADVKDRARPIDVDRCNIDTHAFERFAQNVEKWLAYFAKTNYHYDFLR
jgi:hypothetical protein